jgi:hypothetical protein
VTPGSHLDQQRIVERRDYSARICCAGIKADAEAAALRYTAIRP